MSKKILKNVAGGLLKTFVSRNNDINGYWGLGVLRFYAEQNGKEQIDLNLLEPQHENKLVEFCGNNYKCWLQKTLERRGLSFSSLTRAEIQIRFEHSFVNYSGITKDTYGLPYVCTVELAGSTGKRYSMIKVGVCGPHDPLRESRSTRS